MLKRIISQFNKYIYKSVGYNPTVIDYVRHAVGGIIDYVIFGATVTDHFELSMINKSFSEKSKYMTWRESKRFISMSDKPEVISLYRKKNSLYKRLDKYTGRCILSLSDCSKEEIDHFLSTHSQFIYKPNDKSCGIGIRKIETQYLDDNEIQSMIKDGGIFDELIIQHPYMAAICPASVNTIRVFTFKNDSRVYFIGAVLRIGNGKDVIDNYSAGGQVCALDLDDGHVLDKAEDMFGNRTQYSPSGTDLTTVSIPMWQELKSFVTKMALDFEMNYVAWDIAVCQNGFKLVEANPKGMVNVIQIAGNGGKKARYKELEKLIAAR